MAQDPAVQACVLSVADPTPDLPGRSGKRTSVVYFFFMRTSFEAS